MVKALATISEGTILIWRIPEPADYWEPNNNTLDKTNNSDSIIEKEKE
jgi:hypothetical protein